MSASLQALGQSLEHWQALYIISLLIGALSTFAILIFAFHIKEAKNALKFSNYAYLLAAWLAVVSTIVIISKTRSIGAEKDRELKKFEAQANVQIQQFRSIAARANQEAQDAKLKSEQTSHANAILRAEVLEGQKKSKEAEAELASENKKTLKFTQALQTQQENMAEQMHVSPVLSDSQISALAKRLKPFAGEDVILHSTPDTTVLRTKYAIVRALNEAGIKHSQNSIDMGALYGGISVVVHAAAGRPPLADALVFGLRDDGIVVHPVSLRSIPEGRVAIYLGPY